MINLKSNKNQKFNEITPTQILFYAFPASFILGNLLLTLNLLLFIAFGLILIKKEKLTYRFENFYWLIAAFFLYFFLLTIIQYQSPGYLNDTIKTWPIEKNPIFKSFALIRFIILVFVLNILIVNNILNLRKFFLSCLLFSSFVCFDVILQYITGFDLFGLENFDRWNSGPFGDELIAGSYLQKFCFFSIFYILLFSNLNEKFTKNFLLTFVITLSAVAILLAGNRMPMFLFLFGIVLIFLLVKKMRFVTALSLFIFLSIFFIVSKNDPKIGMPYLSFLNEINITKIFKINKEDTKKDSEKIEDTTSIPKDIVMLRMSGHNRIFNTAVEMWKEQPIFGFGLKSFRLKCWDMLAKDNAKRKINPRPQYISCANHPHNYYLELLSEGGIIGTSLFLIIVIFLSKNFLIYLIKNRKLKNSDLYLIVPVSVLFFLEVWPIRSTGSFFTTWNATFFWIIVAILLSFKEKKSS